MKLKSIIISAALGAAAVLSLSAKADVVYKSYDGIKVGIDSGMYWAAAGPFVFYEDEKTGAFDFPLEDVMSGGISVLYNKTDMILDLVFEGNFSEEIGRALASWKKKCPRAIFLSRITLSDGQFFACPLEIVPEEDNMVLARVADATFSSKIEEIGSDRFNKWSTLKYLCSRLCKFTITRIEFACDDPDGDFTNLCNVSVNAEFALTPVKEVIEALSEASGDRDFLKYSWEVE